MEGSSEADPESASSEILTPGRIAPPIKLRSSVTTVILVAVPKSMMMAGRGYFSAAPTAVQARSAPREAGSSMRILRPVLTPGPTTMVGIWPLPEDADGIVEYGGERGTTEEMAAPGKLGRFELMQAEDLREKDGVFRFGTQGIRLGAGQ